LIGTVPNKDRRLGRGKSFEENHYNRAFGVRPSRRHGCRHGLCLRRPADHSIHSTARRPLFSLADDRGLVAGLLRTPMGRGPLRRRAVAPISAQGRSRLPADKPGIDLALDQRDQNHRRTATPVAGHGPRLLLPHYLQLSLGPRHILHGALRFSVLPRLHADAPFSASLRAAHAARSANRSCRPLARLPRRALGERRVWGLLLRILLAGADDLFLSKVKSGTDRLKSVPHSGAVAAKNLSHLGKAAPDFGRQLIGSVAPAPVAAFAGWHVHPGLAAQAQHVLQRNDRGVGDRAERQPDEIPVDLMAVSAE